MTFSKNQRFCRKIGDLKKNTVVFYKGKCSSTDFEELYLRAPAMDFDNFWFFETYGVLPAYVSKKIIIIITTKVSILKTDVRSHNTLSSIMFSCWVHGPVNTFERTPLRASFLFLLDFMNSKWPSCFVRRRKRIVEELAMTCQAVFLNCTYSKVFKAYSEKWRKRLSLQMYSANEFRNALRMLSCAQLTAALVVFDNVTAPRNYWILVECCIVCQFHYNETVFLF